MALTKTLIGLVAAVLVVAIVLTLYATGPSRKASTKRCQFSPSSAVANAIIAGDSLCVLRGKP